MAKRTPYIKTKQELTSLKNFSDVINTMINHIEKIQEIKNLKEVSKSDQKYILYRNKTFEYIILYLNKDNGNHCIEMKENIEDKYNNYVISNNSIILYISSIAFKNKKNTQFICDQINTLSNIKASYIPLLKELIKKYDKENHNTFFSNSKTYCINEITNIINSEFNAKKIYTMILNKLNIIENRIEKYKEFTSNFQRTKINNQHIKNISIASNELDMIISDIKEINIFTNDHLKKWQRKYYAPYRQLYTNLENLYSIDYETDYIESDNGNKYYHFDSEKKSPEYYFLDDFGNPLSLEEQNIKLKEKSEYQEKMNDPEYLLQTYHSKETIEELKDALTNIADKLSTYHQLKVITTKLERSMFFLFPLIDIFTNYFEIIKFKKHHNYKSMSIAIKHFYKNKIDNKKNRSKYDEYVDNPHKRSEKVLEIKYLDKYIINNKYILLSIFNMDKEASYEYMKSKEQDIEVFMKYLEDKLFQEYYNDDTILEKKLLKLDQIEFFYYHLQDIDIDTSTPRRIITRSKNGVELFNVYRYENNIYPKFKLKKDLNIFDLDYQFNENDIIPFIPDQKYFTQTNF